MEHAELAGNMARRIRSGNIGTARRQQAAVWTLFVAADMQSRPVMQLISLPTADSILLLSSILALAFQD